VNAQPTVVTPTYQWSYNNAPLANSGHVVGVTTSVLSLINIRQTDAGSYTCTVTTPCPTNGVGSALLTVLPDSTVKSVVILKPLTAKPTVAALVNGSTPAVFAIGNGNTNSVVPQVDLIGRVTDIGLITGAAFVNTNDGSTIPATFVASTNDWTPITPTAKSSTYFHATVTLLDGTNSYTAVATNETGSVGVSKSTKPVVVYYEANPSTCTILTNGTGHVQAKTIDKIWGFPTAALITAPVTLEVGHVYSIKATATGLHHTFVQWDLSDNSALISAVPTGTTVSTLTFTMKANLQITAKFSDSH